MINSRDKDNYFDVNAALNSTFFDGRFSGLPVYLDLERDIAKEVAERLGERAEDLELRIGDAVSRSINHVKGDPYSYHLKWKQDWAINYQKGPPPFTALLCALSIAAEHMAQGQKVSELNYYERLCILLGIEGNAQKQKLRSYAKQTEALWQSLNAWLSKEDFCFGMPTAKPLTNKKYVSYAISQALIRDADRERFSRLFESYGLKPGQSISEAEMALIIDQWMQGATGPTKWLRRLWAEDDLRERVISAAISELQLWEGNARHDIRGQAFAGARLEWLASFSTFPKRKALFVIGVQSDLSEERGVRIGDDKLGEDFFGASPNKLALAPWRAGISILEPAKELRAADLILTPFELTDTASGSTYRHIPKPVIPLVKAEDCAFYREAQRVALFTDCIILCNANWRSKVCDYLNSNARPGFQVLEPEQMPGIPDGWILIKSVELVNVPADPEKNLDMLAPISGSGVIEFTGGLNLRGGVWHSGAPPQVCAASDSDGPPKVLVYRQTLEGGGELLASEELSRGKVTLPLSSLTSGEREDLRIVLTKSNKHLKERTCSFRDANSPLPPSPNVAAIAYSLNGETPAGVLSAMDIPDDGSGAPLLYGNVVVGESVGVHFDELAIKPSSSTIPEGDDHHSEDLPSMNDEKRGAVGQGSCVIRGYHIWQIPPYQKGEDRYQSKIMWCKDCGLSAISRSRKQAKRAQKLTKTGEPAPRVGDAKNATATYQPERSEPSVDIDVLFDGLCYLHSGGISRFRRLCNAASDVAWFDQELLGNLVALGHVDVKLDRNLKPVWWAVAPPAIVTCPNGVVFLAGFQNRRLVQSVRERLESAGAKHVELRQDGAPTVNQWWNISENDLRHAVGDIEDPFGRKLKVSATPGYAIAEGLPKLNSLWEIFPTVHFEQFEQLEYFCPQSNKWNRSNRFDELGAYRTWFGGRRYLYKGLSGDVRELPFEVAKIVAASQRGTALHSYDEESQTFISALGAEPPGIYERALVIASGSLPIKKNGKKYYSGVPLEIGSKVLNKLYLDG